MVKVPPTLLLSIHHVTLLSPQTHHTMKMEAGTAILSATVIVIHYYLQLTTINVNMLIVLFNTILWRI